MKHDSAPGPSGEGPEAADAAISSVQDPLGRRTIGRWSGRGRVLLAFQDEKAGKLEGWGWWLLGVLALVVLAVVSIGLGRYPLGAAKLLSGIVAAVIPHAGTHLSSIDVIVLLQIRLPRVLAAIMVGAALSGAGAAYQNMFRNPLVSPDILGVSAGAGFGASLGLFFNLPFAEVQLFAFVGGVVSVALTVGVAQVIGRGSTIVLVLAGIVIGAMAQALISLTQYFANPTTTLPRIVFFLLGSLDSVTWSNNLWVPAVLVTISILLLYALRWPITVLAAGEDEARTLGVNRRVVWSVVIVATTLMTASVVAVAGIVGWVGLVVPHMARYVVGPSFHRLLPASLLIGAFFLLAVDDIGRSAASIEFPLGVLTALIGAPFFIALLARGRDQWR
jgi:iron complex transport system permease protein